MTQNDDINGLLRGIATNNIETTRASWRSLLETPEESAAMVCAKLESDAWAEQPRGPAGRFFAVLLALLAEVDASAFAREIERLGKERLHPQHRLTLKVLAVRVSDNPVGELGNGTPVYVSDDIDERSLAFRNVIRWSKTPGIDLENITRVDIVARQAHLDYLGLYDLILSGIVLTWPAARMRGAQLWYERMSAEFTFYHEVGHHALGHAEGGTVADQEEEADEYAREAMRKAHPILVPIVRLTMWPVKKIIAKSLRDLKQQHPAHRH